MPCWQLESGLTIVSLLNRIVFIPDVHPPRHDARAGRGIDYALFLVVRHRQLLRHAIRRSGCRGRTRELLARASFSRQHPGSGCLWPGLTGLRFPRVARLCSSDSGSGRGSRVGDLRARHCWACWVRRILRGGGVGDVDDSTDSGDEHLDRGMWARLATAVTRDPGRSPVGSTLLLLALAAPTLSLNLGHADAGILPPEPLPVRPGDLTTEAFGPGCYRPAGHRRESVRTRGSLRGTEAQSPATTSADGGGGDRGRQTRDWSSYARRWRRPWGSPVLTPDSQH